MTVEKRLNIFLVELHGDEVISSSFRPTSMATSPVLLEYEVVSTLNPLDYFFLDYLLDVSFVRYRAVGILHFVKDER